MKEFEAQFELEVPPTLNQECRQAVQADLSELNKFLEQDDTCDRLAATCEDALALNDFGWRYLTGDGVPQNTMLAQGLFLVSANEGCATALVNLGQIAASQGSYYSSLFWNWNAARLGDLDGEFNYASLIFNGLGTEQDYALAHQIFLRLFSARHYAGTCYYLGYYAEHGLIADPDYVLAKEYYELGVLQDDMHCCTNLGRFYSLGRGVEPDSEMAFRLYRKGAELGNGTACASLGSMYENGIWVDQDIPYARKLYQIAADRGSQYAADALNRLQNMTGS